jgi:hypothetical protein
VAGDAQHYNMTMNLEEFKQRSSFVGFLFSTIFVGCLKDRIVSALQTFRQQPRALIIGYPTPV